VGNRVRSGDDEEAIRRNLEGAEILGFVPMDEAFMEADREGVLPYPDPAEIPDPVKAIATSIHRSVEGP